MSPDKRDQLQALLEALEEAIRGMRAADQAVGDGNDSLRGMLDAQSRAIAAHGVVIDAALAANRIVRELIEDRDS